MEIAAGRDPVNIGIVGYQLVGRKLAEILLEREFLFDGIRIFASERSAGEVIRLPDTDREVTIELASEADYSGLDIVFNAAPADFSKAHAERIHQQGPIFIDSSSAWRQDPRVPLLIPEINPEVVDDLELGIVAKPNCTTTIGAMALHCLHQEAGLKSLIVSTYQSTSGQGRQGVMEHRDQLRELAGREDELLHGQVNPYPKPAIFPAITALNVAPLAGTFENGSDHTTEELKFKNETRKIFGLTPRDLPIGVTCARSSVINGHSLSVSAEFESEITAARAHEILAQADGVELHEREDVPQPIYVVGSDAVHVGRVRQSERDGLFGLDLWICADNLRKGAALNMVQGAELLIKR